MFIVTWEGEPPERKSEWIRILREVLEAASGSYEVHFRRAPGGWRFSLTLRSDLGASGTGVIANTLEGVRFNLHYMLWERGLPVDPEWDVTQE